MTQPQTDEPLNSKERIVKKKRRLAILRAEIEKIQQEHEQLKNENEELFQKLFPSSDNNIEEVGSNDKIENPEDKKQNFETVQLESIETTHKLTEEAEKKVLEKLLEDDETNNSDHHPNSKTNVEEELPPIDENSIDLKIDEKQPIVDEEKPQIDEKPIDKDEKPSTEKQEDLYKLRFTQSVKEINTQINGPNVKGIFTKKYDNDDFKKLNPQLQIRIFQEQKKVGLLN